ncbi:MAG: hypothetical protein ACE5OZ_25355 [Candidatus Heimdallarchaeota archaeon]
MMTNHNEKPILAGCLQYPKEKEKIVPWRSEEEATLKKAYKSLFTIIVIVIALFGLTVTIAHSKDAIGSLEQKTLHNDLQQLMSQEAFTQTAYSELNELSSLQDLQISRLKDFERVQSSIIYDSVEFWLLNFTYDKVYQTAVSQLETSGVIQYSLNESIRITVFASLPIILATYRNTSLQTNTQAQIITQAIVNENYPAIMGFSINFDLDYYFKAKVFGFGPEVGPGQINLPFQKTWAFETPMNGKAVLGKVGASFPTLVPLLGLGVSVGPSIDADFSADVRTNSTGISLSENQLDWETDGSLQSLAMDVPEFYSEETATIDLFDFDMTFSLDLVFYLDVTVGLPLFNKVFHFPIFAFPVTQTHLTTENLDALYLIADIEPSDDVPFVYGVEYYYADSDGDDDGILELGETVNFSLLITNLGTGSAIAVNTTVSSPNVTVSGQTSAPLLMKNRGNYELQSGFQFTIPSDYSGTFILANASFEYLAVNGSTWTSTYEVYFRVVQPGDTYLEVTEIYLDYPGAYWQSGDELGIYFNVTNRGAAAIENATIWVAAGGDTDITTPASFDSTTTNNSDLSFGASTILGSINISSPGSHDDGLIYLVFYVYYEDATYAYFDLFYLTLPIFFPKPEFDLISAVGYDTDVDGDFEAGETIEVEFTIQNIGAGVAENTVGVIISDDADLNISVAEAMFGDVGISESQTSTKTKMQIPLTARNQTATFILHLVAFDANGREISQAFNVSMEIVEAPLPQITLLSYTIDDSVYGNGDGYADPGELFLLYVNIQVEHTGFQVTSSAATASMLYFYNASSFYGDMQNQTSSGDGFIVEVPLNYGGGPAVIDVTVSAESLSGRKVSATGAIELLIDAGDLTAPTMILQDTIPTQVLQNDDFSFRFSVEDSSSPNEIVSGIDKALCVWIFNNSDIEITELSDPDSDGIYEMALSTTAVGTYYFILVALDAASNLQYIALNDEVFVVDVVAVAPGPTSESSTTAISDSKTSTKPSSGFTITLLLASTIFVCYVWRRTSN